MRQNDQDIKSVLHDLVETYRLRPKLNQTKVRTLWEEQMGPTILRYTRSISLKNGVLYIALSSSSLKQELSYGKDKIRTMLNEGIGEEAVREVVFV
jgi:predicted nucleic acid-binding Zn ribbon protein